MAAEEGAAGALEDELGTGIPDPLLPRPPRTEAARDGGALVVGDGLSADAEKGPLTFRAGDVKDGPVFIGGGAGPEGGDFDRRREPRDVALGRVAALAFNAAGVGASTFFAGAFRPGNMATVSTGLGGFLTGGFGAGAGFDAGTGAFAAMVEYDGFAPATR